MPDKSFNHDSQCSLDTLIEELVQNKIEDIAKHTRVRTKGKTHFSFETKDKDLRELAFAGMMMGIEQWADMNGLALEGLEPEKEPVEAEEPSA